MFTLRLLFLMAIALSFWTSQALAAEKTTAVWSDGRTSALSDEELVRHALVSPRVAYPEEAQTAKIAGNGLYELRVDKAGATIAVAIVKSSGSALLDKAATSTFKKWRFKPAVFRAVRIPVSWSVKRVR